MPHVGVERLTAGDDEHDRPEDEDPAETVAGEKLDSPSGRKSGEDLRLLDDLSEAEEGERRKPDEHHRSKQPPHVASAPRLDREQPHQDQAGDRNDEFLQGRAGDREPLHRRQHRDRRSDHAVAIEERCADDRQERHPRNAADPAGGVAESLRHQRQQRQNPPFAAMVGPHHKDDVLHRDDEEERPEHERQYAEQVGAVDHAAIGCGDMETLLERVEGTGADVTVYHAEREERQPQDIRCRGGAVRSMGVSTAFVHSMAPRSADCPPTIDLRESGELWSEYLSTRTFRRPVPTCPSRSHDMDDSAEALPRRTWPWPAGVAANPCAPRRRCRNNQPATALRSLLQPREPQTNRPRHTAVQRLCDDVDFISDLPSRATAW